MITTSILIVSLLRLGKIHESILAPIIEWRVSKTVVAGEPVFLEYIVKNPNDRKITVNFKPGRETWFATSFGSTSSIPDPVRESKLDEARGMTTQLIEPHAVCRRVVSLTLPGYARSAGDYRVWIRGSLAYRSGASYVESQVNGDQVVSTNEHLPLRVEAPSDEALENAADRIGRSVFSSNAAPAEGIDPSACPNLVAVWFSMPSEQSLPSWRRYLVAGKIDAFLPQAVGCLRSSRDAAARAFIGEIVAYVHVHRPDLEARLKVGDR